MYISAFLRTLFLKTLYQSVAAPCGRLRRQPSCVYIKVRMCWGATQNSSLAVSGCMAKTMGGAGVEKQVEPGCPILQGSHVLHGLTGMLLGICDCRWQNHWPRGKFIGVDGIPTSFVSDRPYYFLNFFARR